MLNVIVVAVVKPIRRIDHRFHFSPGGKNPVAAKEPRQVVRPPFTSSPANGCLEAGAEPPGLLTARFRINPQRRTDRKLRESHRPKRPGRISRGALRHDQGNPELRAQGGEFQDVTTDGSGKTR